MKRQQAFIASMAHPVGQRQHAGQPDRLTKFLDAATKSLTVDPGLKSIAKLAGLAYQFRHIGLDNIQFVTIAVEVDPANPNRVSGQPTADQLWKDIINDQGPAQVAAQRVDQRPPHPGA